ncbi:MAG: hypothetical protein QW567_03800, partial [Candidatus Hadarchaeales archaeon]
MDKKLVIPLVIAVIAVGLIFSMFFRTEAPRVDVGWLPVGDVPAPTHIVVARGDGEACIWWEPPEGGADGYRIYFLNYAPLWEEINRGKTGGENDRPFIEISLSSPPSGFDPEHPRMRLTGLRNGVHCVLGLSAWRYTGGGKIQSEPVPLPATALAPLPKGVAAIVQEGGAYDRGDLRDAVERYLEAAVGELSPFGYWNAGVREIRREKVLEIPDLADGIIESVISWGGNALEDLNAFQGWLENAGLSVPWDLTNNLDLARNAIVERTEKIGEMSGKI